MSSVRGLTWDFEGNRLSIKNALALCYAYGFKGGKTLMTAVCVMTAESGRYVKAWNHNHGHREDGEHGIKLDGTLKRITSTDRGLFQINDEAHPWLSDEEAFKARENVQAAWEVYLRRGGEFTAWAAYNSGAYLKHWPAVFAVWVLGRWKERVEFWGD